MEETKETTSISQQTKDNRHSNKSNINRTAYIYLKAEKLSFVLYKLSDLISDSEPLKTKIRDESLSMISDLSKVNRTDDVLKTDSLLSALSHARTIQSFLSFGRAGNLFSEMNYDVLRREFENFASEIARNTNNASDDITPYLYVALPAPKQNLHDRNTTDVASRHTLGPRKLNQNRRREIVDFLAQNGTSSIKDICAGVTGYGEKTVQRELASLVEAGILERTGERRWSRYSLLEGKMALLDAPHAN